ncbi:MAG: helix-turn-helix domain-containing protein [Candidatus Binatia bacterium]
MRRDGMAEEARALRDSISRLERTAKTTPIPSGVRVRIVAFAARACEAGWSLPRVARAVGVSVGSVRNWRRAPPAAALVPVVVTSRPLVERAALTVVGPSGYRVEGLDVPTTAALLRALE